VRSGASSHVRSLRDLGADNIRLSMPDPEWEGVARQIADSLKKAGGDDLYHKVYEQKVRTGTTYLTHIHHRQTPMRILSGESDAGVTWASEVRFQERIGNPISGVQIPAVQNTTGTYAAGVLRDAPHRDAARAWVEYLRSREAQAIYAKFGFGMVSGEAK
jgi:ABC-type Fe3+ transport system substrate-binding protein